MHKVKEFENYLLNKGRSKNTIKQYDFVLNSFFTKYLPDKKIEEITKQDVEGFISWKISRGEERTDKNLSGLGQGRQPSKDGELLPTTINSNLSPLRKFFAYCEREDLAASIELARLHRWQPPLFEIDMEKITNLFKSKTLNELEEMTRVTIIAGKKNKDAPIESFFVKRNSLLFFVLFNSGIRIGEANTLEEMSFKFDLKAPAMLVDGKTGKRTILLSPEVAERIKAFIQEFNIKGRLFCTIAGGPLSVNTLKTYIWEMFCLGLGETYHAHTLRHAYATFMLDRGVPIKKVSNDMGHTSTATTSIYQDVIKGKNQEAMSPMDFIQGEKK